MTIGVPEPVRAERLATHRALIGRKLAEAMRRPVRVSILTTAEARDQGSGARGSGVSMAAAVPGPADAEEGREPEAEPPIPSFLVAECGLPSGQVWSAVLADLATGGDVSRANFDAWLRSTALVGRGGDGAAGTPLVVGVPHPLAQRRVASRFLPALRAAVARVVGAPLAVELAVARDWVAAHSDAPQPSGEDTNPAVRAGA